MNSLATLFFRNRHLLALATIIAMVAGFAALQSMPRLEDPIITQRNPLILTSIPGASAERVEALVSKPIEDALAEIPEIKSLQSTSRDGFSLVRIELNDSVIRSQTEAIFSRIRDQMAEAARRFPAEALPPEFDEKRGAVAFTLVASVTWEADGEPLPGIMKRHAEALADRLRNLPGTEIVRVYGAATEEFLVEMDPVSLAGLAMTTAEVAAVIRNAGTKSPAGVLYARDSQIALEVEAELGAAERLGAIPLKQNVDGGLVHLRDVATIRRGWNEPLSSLASADGKTAVMVAARVQRDWRADHWSESAKRIVDDYRTEIGRGIGIDTTFDQSAYTTARLGELLASLLLGGLVVIAVVFFTMGWRSALIVGSALPLTSAATFFLIGLTGGSLQQMSIFGIFLIVLIKQFGLPCFRDELDRPGAILADMFQKPEDMVVAYLETLPPLLQHPWIVREEIPQVGLDLGVGMLVLHQGHRCG